MPVEWPLDHGGPCKRPFTAWPRHQLDEPVFARFAAFAQSCPEHPAVIEANRIWTYGDIYRLALQIAAHIEPLAPAPIAVLLPSGGPLVAAFLGALATGCPYVPIDPTFPPERNRLILEQAGVKGVLSDPAGLLTVASLSNTLCLLDIEALEERQPCAWAGKAESIAYIIYTSGSTGQPKGIYQDQRGLLHDVYQFSHAIHINPDDRLTSLYSPSVNGAIRDIYAAVLNGATLVSISIRDTGLAELAQMVARHGITIFHAIPPLLRAFLHSEPSADCLASVRLAYIAGDRCFADDIALFYRHFPASCLIYNGIGSTECATLYRHWFITRETVLTTPLVPVGYPIAERETRLLDAHGQPVADGEVGEVEISSPFIAQGYWRNLELTRQSFHEHPQRPGWRCFLSGDLARTRPDGLLDFVGRKDGQVKIRGHRVELAIVEAALRQIAAIQEVAVLVVGPPENPELAAWLSGQLLPPETLRRLLHQQLPDAFIPAAFYWLEQLPKLPNHKADLAALRQLLPDKLKPPPSPPLVGNNTPPTVLNQLEECWLQALRQTGPINSTLSFATQGGQSLAAMMLLTRLEKLLQRRLPVSLMSTDQTFAGLVQALMAPVEPEAILYIVSDHGGDYPGLVEFILTLPKTVHVQRVPEPENPNSALSIPAMGMRIASHIRAQQPSCPVHLLGFSLAGYAAFAAACELADAGVAVQSLIMADIDGSPALTDNWQPRHFPGTVTLLLATDNSNGRKTEGAWEVYSPKVNHHWVACGQGQLLGEATAARVRDQILAAIGLVSPRIRRNARKPR
ncbi:MAG: amino acid adenylation domain-containing protein [Methylovulum sp.]|nr:amino acid adenylation domain-containing protein [Methylovulum sp.]